MTFLNDLLQMGRQKQQERFSLLSSMGQQQPTLGGFSMGPSVGASGYTAGDVLLPGSDLLASRRGVTLQDAALQSLVQAGRQLGYPILPHITSGYRTPEQQAALYAQKPGLAAPPGKSYHQQGLAIDINSGWLSTHPEVQKLLLNLGWNQFNSSKEPWHFSYGVTG